MDKAKTNPKGIEKVDENREVRDALIKSFEIDEEKLKIMNERYKALKGD